MAALLLIRASMLNLSFIFFLQAKAAIINFKVSEIFRRLRQAFEFSMKPGCLSHGCSPDKQTHSFLCDGLFYSGVPVGVGYLYIMCLIGFFSEHACMSQGKKCDSEPIRPHYVNIASGSFLWHVFFASWRWLHLFIFFANTFLKTTDLICKKIK